MLEARGLRKRFGTVAALDGFELSVEAGEICGLLGHNGAGKTTFARICAGLERPDAGRVLLAGTDPSSSPARARALIGYAPQEIALYPTATLRENLRFYGGLAGLRRSTLRSEIAAIAEAVLLTDALDRPVATLSGGQQRRAQAATVLLPRPPILLLDEPTVGADPVTRQALLALVRERAAQGAAVCYTTHYLPELEELDATVAVAQAGRIIARGRREELLAGLPSTVALEFAQNEHADEHADEHPDTDTDADADGGLSFVTGRPAETLARVLTSLGERVGQVERIEIREPSLDDLYRHLTAANQDTAIQDAADQSTAKEDEHVR
ncbi:ABC transporter ATP-binding protein [Actinospica durhamensis]|uniref:ABC transporter ATP-binding protein n=1 Tax=Actinospica durhamensis TaxID=1508375 RepID=A0A941ETW2_9ACTN|nr:ABC transporter ATP-binding protein [Actinospica durhamensis]MBR7836317.1 ABC transporter ATP-binding protein [Actinospica durhamensis]